ncbi:hypothetical protein [Alteribacillus sp. HJP-4]|uniref:hypothetical protein n=1 Tax=Alteribacillus sp. HJP-4 TaxID=2775394 RepID=UPI0035CCE361
MQTYYEKTLLFVETLNKLIQLTTEKKPTVSELAVLLGCSEELVLESMEFGRRTLYAPSTIH